MIPQNHPLDSLKTHYSILVARDRLPDTVTRMLRNKLLLPDRPDQRPHAHFLCYHRDQIFKS
jgi:putative restriction endonuclease